MTDRPTEITGPGAWIGAEMARDPGRWLYILSDADVADLERAARHFAGTGRDIGEISADTFPLTSFSSHIDKLRATMLTGTGVEVIRGLSIADYDRATAATIFCGIGAHLGSARSQNAQGHILGHVRDTGANASDPNTRIYQTAERQTFHTDSADVVGLLCLRTAREGGRSLLVSAETIYNRMMAARPDLCALLFDPISTDRRGEIPEGAEPFFSIPVFSWHAGHLTVCYQRQYIESARRFDGAFPLTEAHIEALNLFDTLANDPELHFAMDLEPGDIQFVYNHAQLHDRTAFTDWPEPENRRHLLRLWLSLPGDRDLPPSFIERYGSTEPGNRGGIVTRETRLHAPLD